MGDLSWFSGAGLGLFVHWDHASQQGIETSWPLVGRGVIPGGEVEDVVSIEQYQASAATFDPSRWDPQGLARLARECGARYVVLTARHHAGYSMFHTRQSSFSIESSPYGADIVRSLVEAVRAEGLKVGLYYSLPDWHHEDYPRFEESDRPYVQGDHRRSSPEAWARYVEYLKEQLTELLTGYGAIDLLWFDGEWERTANEWHAKELGELVRALQPNAIINDRLPGEGDYVTPEQGLPEPLPAGPWELCLTMGQGWGWRPAESDWKSARQIARTLAEVAAHGGNLLLNVSPTGDGSLPEVQVERLHDLRDWVAAHGVSVLGVQPAPPSVRFYGPVTWSGSTLYVHLVMRPTEKLSVRGVTVHRVCSVTLLDSGSSLPYTTTVEIHAEQHDGDAALGELLIDVGEPSAALHDVVAIEFDGPL